MNVTSTSPQIENTVFIVIQKLLAAAQISRGEGTLDLIPLLSTLNYSVGYSGHDSRSNHNNSNYNNNSFSDNNIGIGVAVRTFYSPGTVGCFLSGHLLARTGTDSGFSRIELSLLYDRDCYYHQCFRR